MWRNYFTIALRNLYKRRPFTSINIFGLMVGLACCALVILFVRHELRYDTFHSRYQDIHRLIYKYRSQTYTVTPFPDWWDTPAEDQLIKTEALKKIPEVEQVAQFNVTYGEIMNNHSVFIEVEKGAGPPERFSERKVLITNTGQELLDIFNWEFLAGDASRACAAFYTVILTESIAKKYFGKDWKTQSLLDRSLRWEDREYRITGVIEDVPEYAHYDFNMILHVPAIPSWGVYTYLLLHPDADVQEVNKKINDVLVSLEPDIADNPYEKGSYLQAIADIHLYSDYLYELKPPGDIRYLYAFCVIGLIILLITCTNYINLSVAMHADRHKEIGMRKVVGAYKSNILWQFLTETILLTLLCLPLALLLLQAMLPFFNQLMNLRLQNEFLSSLPSFSLLAGITLITGLLSGLFPAWILSHKKPVILLKGSICHHREGLLMRRILVVFQFSLLIVLSSATFFINQQLRYIHNKDIGFDKEGIISFDPVTMENYRAIKNKLQSYPEIEEVGAGILPGMRMSSQITYKLDNTDEQFVDGTLWEMDYGAARALGIRSQTLEQIERGNKDFNEILLINNSAAKTLSAAAGGIPQDDLIGLTVTTNLEYESNNGEGYGDTYTISGFVEDVHLHSLRQEINPLFIRITKDTEWLYHAIVRIDTENVSETIGLIQGAYDDVVNNFPFEVNFLEEQLKKLYAQEQQVSTLTVYLSIVAVVLAVLGLIGLTAYQTSLRVKEIGVRKVMGASVGEILLLLNKEFIFLITVATAIATPIAYLAIHKWLSDFAYRININLAIFLLIGFIAFLISVAVVTIQSIKAATTNPVQTIRRE